MPMKENYFVRPQDVHDALQMAIERWFIFQKRIWEREHSKEREIRRLRLSGTILRVIIIILAGTVTIMAAVAEIENDVSPLFVPILSGLVTILTGVEGYLKLADKATSADNRRTEILSEYDRQGYEWMVKVHLETDPDAALKQAKDLLQYSPDKINTIIARYMPRESGEAQKGS